MKYERQINVIQDRLNIYASFLFYLKKLRELLNIDSLIGSKLYLLSPDMITGWVQLDKDYRNGNAINRLFETIISEYNNKILDEYKEITGISLLPLQD
jgi:hypothetical protein